MLPKLNVDCKWLYQQAVNGILAKLNDNTVLAVGEIVLLVVHELHRPCQVEYPLQ
jgi:hypothetical protein